MKINLNKIAAIGIFSIHALVMIILLAGYRDVEATTYHAVNLS